MSRLPAEVIEAETRHQRANRLTVEAIQIAWRDGQTPADRARIYEREIERLTAVEPAYLEPLKAATAVPVAN